MIIYKKRGKIDIGGVRKLGMVGKITGLMFKSKNAERMLFEFAEDTDMPIHSFFVFFSFLAVWTDKKNRFLECSIVKPFTSIINPRKKYRKLVEIPVNDENMKIIEFFVGKGKI